MTWIDLGNPRPHPEPKIYVPFCWPLGDIYYLFEPEKLPTKPLSKILEHRRTRRSFDEVSDEDLCTLLWLTCRGQAWSNSASGLQLCFRPTPSAGAIHPIHVLVSSKKNRSWQRYVPTDHTLAGIEPIILSPEKIREAVENVVPPEDGTILLFIAEPGKTLAKYADGCSLIWRDAGVLLGYMSLVAESLDLNFCPLGITGEPWASHLDEEGRLVGVGMALLGSSWNK
ncbi:nitroreductase family protein [Undibacterium sp. Ji83W]|uniref:nitroreductase family protein n=1 Tax=Undibacterium sp. Ji83W TaxID=3413043 RepID=UPI003BEFEE1C